MTTLPDLEPAALEAITDKQIGEWCAEAQGKCFGVIPQARYVIARALAARSVPEAGKRLPIPDGVSMTGGLICLGYEDADERDLAYDALEAYGAGATSTLALPPPTGGAEPVDSPEEIEIDRLRLAAFKTNSNEDKAAYYLAVSKWFQDRHYRRLATPQAVAPTEEVAGLVERLKIEASEDLDGEVRESAIETMREAATALRATESTISDLRRQRDDLGKAWDSCDSDRQDLRRKLEEAERQRDDWKATHGRVVEGFMEVCDAVGVQFDAPEAVAYAINAKIGNAEHDKRAAEAKLEEARKALARPFPRRNGGKDG